jgi:hypothetical protein
MCSQLAPDLLQYRALEGGLGPHPGARHPPSGAVLVDFHAVSPRSACHRWTATEPIVGRLRFSPTL